MSKLYEKFALFRKNVNGEVSLSEAGAWNDSFARPNGKERRVESNTRLTMQRMRIMSIPKFDRRKFFFSRDTIRETVQFNSEANAKKQVTENAAMNEELRLSPNIVGVSQ